MSTYNNPNFDKKLYWERRKRGLRGTVGAVTVHQPDPDGGESVPIGDKVRNGTMNSRRMSRQKVNDPKNTKRRASKR